MYANYVTGGINLITHNFKRHKYRVSANKQARTVDGIIFPSLKEARYYAELKLRVNAGEVLFFLRQVPFHLPPAFPITKYVCDFMEFWSDGSVHIIDTEGFKTNVYKQKKKLVETSYPVKIEEK